MLLAVLWSDVMGLFTFDQTAIDAVLWTMMNCVDSRLCGLQVLFAARRKPPDALGHALEVTV